MSGHCATPKEDQQPRNEPEPQRILGLWQQLVLVGPPRSKYPVPSSATRFVLTKVRQLLRQNPNPGPCPALGHVLALHQPMPYSRCPTRPPLLPDNVDPSMFRQSSVYYPNPSPDSTYSNCVAYSSAYR